MIALRSPMCLPRALLAGLLLALAAVAPAFAGGPGPAALTRTICVDAGHGGTDTGAAYGGLLEKSLTLDIANRLKNLLTNAGYGVVMTRTGDQSLSNTDRANICNLGKVDTVLSIHLNAASDPTVDYFKAFYGKRNKDSAFTQTIWNKYNLTIPNGSAPLPKSSITQFASGLLLKTTAPACLAETVFLSSTAEQQALSDGTGARQQAIAQNLFNGLVAWYNR
jgi:N-acetylmuramoyl-L-alanine amidase